MSFAIHGLGTANPPDAVSPGEGLAIARLLAGPDVRTSTWLGPIYANSGVDRRFQVIGGLAMRDALDGTSHTARRSCRPRRTTASARSTGERMERYAEEAGPLALRASRAALARSRVALGVDHAPRHGVVYRVRCAGRRSRAHRRARASPDG